MELNNSLFRSVCSCSLQATTEHLNVLTRNFLQHKRTAFSPEIREKFHACLFHECALALMNTMMRFVSGAKGNVQLRSPPEYVCITAFTVQTCKLFQNIDTLHLFSVCLGETGLMLKLC